MKLIELNYEELPLEYSYKEVKTLNEITMGSYLLGCTDNEIVAVIGLDDEFVSDIDEKKVSIKVQKNKKEKEMTLISNKLAKECEKDIKFKIYPTQKEFKNDKLLKSTHDMLLKKRANRKRMEEKRKRSIVKKYSIR